MIKKINYHNMANGDTKLKFAVRLYLNRLRTWWYFHVRWPWVKYKGFVRVMKGTSFAHFPIVLGDNVQFGDYCNISTPVVIGNYVLMAGRVCFVGKHDHTFDVPGQPVWNGERGDNGTTIVEDDVWIGHRVTVVGPVKIGTGSIVAAGAVVTTDIPPCEIWGGVPARKLADRFKNKIDMEKHLTMLNKFVGGVRIFRSYSNRKIQEVAA